MNTQLTAEQFVENYLKKVEKKLPEWLKEKKSEKQDILDEIENHIWDKAYEIAKSREPTNDEVHQAIKMIGSPTDITKDYKKRGTPAIYITEELLPVYIKTSIIITAILIVLELIGLVFQIGAEPVEEILLNILGGIFQTAVSVFFFTSLLFVYFSKEGYLPEDLGVKPKSGGASSKSTLNSIGDRPIKIKKASLLIEGLFTIFIGVLLMVQPQLPQFEGTYFPTFSVEFKNFLRVLGIVVLSEGILLLNRTTLSKENLKGHLVLMILIALTVIPSLWLGIWLDANTQILPSFADLPAELSALDALQDLNQLNSFDNINGYQVIIRGAIIFTIIEFIERLVQIIRVSIALSKKK